MIWKIEEARQQFPEIINAFGVTPQLVYQRDRPFVTVIRAELFQEFLTWQRSQKIIPIADAFANLQQLSLEEHYTFEDSPRSDRPNRRPI